MKGEITKYESTCGDLGLGRKRPKYFWDILVSVVGTMYNEEKGNYKENGETEETVKMFKAVEYLRLATYVACETGGSSGVEFEKGFGGIDVSLRIICLEVLF